jgi:plastocyanin
MNLLAIFVFGVSCLMNSLNGESKNPDLVEFEVIEKRTENNGVYYSYTIKNVGATTIPPNSYKVFFKVNGKTISFDKSTSEIKPGKTIVYESQKSFYKKGEGNLHYSLEVKFSDSNMETKALKGESIF